MPRSLGTVACAMLGQHPQMYGILETRLYEVEPMEEWWNFERKHGKTPGGLLRDVAEIIFGDQSERTVERTKRWLWRRRTWPTVNILQALASCVSPLRLVEKNPIPPATDQSIQDSLERRIRCFPQARFLWLVRCPFCYGISLLEMLEFLKKGRHYPLVNQRPGRTKHHKTRQPNQDPQLSWYRVNKNIMAFLGNLPEERHRRIRGEDLLADPDKHLCEIARWLNLRSDLRAIEEMKHPERSPFACMGPPNALGGGDGKFFSSPALRRPNPHNHQKLRVRAEDVLRNPDEACERTNRIALRLCEAFHAASPNFVGAVHQTMSDQSNPRYKTFDPVAPANMVPFVHFFVHRRDFLSAF
jgi:hypothetical protein